MGLESEVLVTVKACWTLGLSSSAALPCDQQWYWLGKALSMSRIIILLVVMVKALRQFPPWSCYGRERVWGDADRCCRSLAGWATGINSLFCFVFDCGALWVSVIARKRQDSPVKVGHKSHCHLAGQPVVSRSLKWKWQDDDPQSTEEVVDHFGKQIAWDNVDKILCNQQNKVKGPQLSKCT